MKNFISKLLTIQNALLALIILSFQSNAFACNTIDSVSFTYKDSAGLVHFTNLSSGSGTHKYLWNFGDGGTSTLKNPSHYNATQNTYSVYLYVTDTINVCTDSAVIYVKNGCQAKSSFTVKDSAGVYYFTNTSVGATNYFWYFGDFGYSYDKNPSHSYTGASQVREIGLSVYNKNIQSCYDSFGMRIFVKTCNKNANFKYKDNAYSANFTPLQTLGVNNFYWDFGDGNTSTIKNPTHTYTSLGNYTVQLIQVDSMNTMCSDTQTQTVIINNCLAKADFSARDSVGTTYFTNLSSNADTYKWYFGDGGTSTLKNPTHKYNYPSQNRIVRLVAVNSQLNSCQDSMSNVIKAGQCNIKMDIYPATQGLKVTLTNKSSNADTYNWDFGDGNSSTLKSPVHTYNTDGSYTIKLIVMNSVNYCKDSITFTVLVQKCDIKADITLLDSNQRYYFKNKTLGNDNVFVWTSNLNWTVPFSYDYEPTFNYGGTAKTYDFRIVIYDTMVKNCFDTVFLSANYPGCKADFRIEDDTTNQYGAVVLQLSKGGTSSKYKWYFGDGDSSSDRTPSHVYSGTGPYNLCLYLYDEGCFSSVCDSLVFDGNGVLKRGLIPFSIKVILPGDVIDNSNSIETISNNSVKLYPNPSQGIVSIESENQAILEIELIDISGKTIRLEQCDAYEKRLDLHDLSKGIYFIKLKFEDQTYTTIKFFKE